jgi:prolyl 4-hydroxylase
MSNTGLQTSDDLSRALDRAQRNFATLEQSVGWLMQTMPNAQRAGNGTSRDLAARLTRASGGGPLAAFARRFESLVSDYEALPHARTAGRGAAEIDAVAIRFENAGCEALELMTAQTGAAAPARGEIIIDDHEVLAEFGRVVRERLDRNPRAFKMPSDKFEVYVVRDFLSVRECEGVIERIDADLVPSGILAINGDATFRTSRSCNFKHDDPVVRAVDTKVAHLLGVDPSFSEMMQGQRYDVGQEFKPHHDYFHKGEYYYEQVGREGGQRTWTAMIFLNTPEAGGFTDFPNAGLRIAPRQGNIVIWNNMDVYGHPNPNSLHHGMPVEAGSKYVITKWFRERRWGMPQAG